MPLAGAASNPISVCQGQTLQPLVQTFGCREEGAGVWTLDLREDGLRSHLGSGHRPFSLWSVVIYPDDLQCVDLELLSNDICANAHSQKVTEFMLCAGHLEGGKDTCVVSQPVLLPHPQASWNWGRDLGSRLPTAVSIASQHQLPQGSLWALPLPLFLPYPHPDITPVSLHIRVHPFLLHLFTV